MRDRVAATDAYETGLLEADRPRGEEGEDGEEAGSSERYPGNMNGFDDMSRFDVDGAGNAIMGRGPVPDQPKTVNSNLVS